MKKAWGRRLIITLTSTSFKKKLVFGDNYENDLQITVNGSKYLSYLKDECIIKITNLTYSEIVQIIQGQFFEVTVQCGYKTTNLTTIFDGGIIYISNEKTDLTSQTVILLCGSKLVARYGQTRINLTLNSGINLYSASKYVTKLAGIRNANISTQLQKKFLDNQMTVNSSVSTWLEKLGTSNGQLIGNSDSSFDAVVSMYDVKNSTSRLITLNNEVISFVNGFPQLTSDGVTFTVLPGFNFVCGDRLKVDNSIIDISTSSRNEASKNYGQFLDTNQIYTVYQINFSLSNRTGNFYLALLCKSNALMKNLIMRS